MWKTARQKPLSGIFFPPPAKQLHRTMRGNFHPLSLISSHKAADKLRNISFAPQGNKNTPR
ncbi:hypothetical protein ccrud_09600 [Corynebacterium crudilactis]|uniref:Uncharacterized protein n=1 Tax=Corynebacterium crudilactis TaxID=1652495 RepID=A0A172QUN8_9CORY|nr:hypothetical protein ccrud_09600 [Corynebacterium crudilactis]